MSKPTNVPRSEKELLKLWDKKPSEEIADETPSTGSKDMNKKSAVRTLEKKKVLAHEINRNLQPVSRKNHPRCNATTKTNTTRKDNIPAVNSVPKLARKLSSTRGNAPEPSKKFPPELFIAKKFLQEIEDEEKREKATEKKRPKVANSIEGMVKPSKSFLRRAADNVKNLATRTINK